MAFLRSFEKTSLKPNKMKGINEGGMQGKFFVVVSKDSQFTFTNISYFHYNNITEVFFFGVKSALRPPIMQFFCTSFIHNFVMLFKAVGILLVK